MESEHEKLKEELLRIALEIYTTHKNRATTIVGEEIYVMIRPRPKDNLRNLQGKK